MKRTFTIIGVAVVSFILGATCVYLMMRPPGFRWMTAKSDGAGFALTDAALNGDIPWPETTHPSGRVKFLSRDKGEQLGYVLKLPMGPNPTSALPEKYRRTKKDKSGLEFGPPDQVLYEGHFEFTLKDADGFVLMKLSGPTEHISAASDNSVQGMTDGTVPTSIIQRIREVDVRFLVTDCNPCQPNDWEDVGTR
jgi:hypothetical protein